MWVEGDIVWVEIEDRGQATEWLGSARPLVALSLVLTLEGVVDVDWHRLRKQLGRRWTVHTPYVCATYSACVVGSGQRAVLCPCRPRCVCSKQVGRQMIDCPRRTVRLVLLEAESHLMLRWRMGHFGRWLGKRVEAAIGDARLQSHAR